MIRNLKSKIQNPKWVGIVALAITFAMCGEVRAQQPVKIPRVGYISGTGEAPNPGPNVEAFQLGLRDLGYAEGRNIVVEYRYSGTDRGRVPAFVAELVQLKVDVLVAAYHAASLAAKQATQSIPIVMVTALDPVATGIVDSLARPGGNITGLTRLTRELSGKRLELLKEMVPKMSRAGVLWDASARVGAPAVAFKEYEAVAPALRIELQSLPVRGPNPDLERAFESAAKLHANALIVIFNPLLDRYAKHIADLAIRNRLPSIYERREYVEDGGLMSYSSNDADNFRRAATYVDKILKGAKPADLPIEQPKKFEFVINLKTAKQIGLSIPPNLLARADKIIR